MDKIKPYFEVEKKPPAKTLPIKNRQRRAKKPENENIIKETRIEPDKPSDGDRYRKNKLQINRWLQSMILESR